MRQHYPPQHPPAPPQDRDSQRRSLRETFCYNKQPDFQLVENCLTSDEGSGDMKVTPELATTFTTVADLRALLRSEHMYANKVVYRRISEGLESGKFRSVAKCQPKPIPEHLTLPHEAYFRMTLYLTMESQGARFSEMNTDLFTEMMGHVEGDRIQNGSAAWETRKKNLGKYQEDEDTDAETAALKEKRLQIPSKYW